MKSVGIDIGTTSISGVVLNIDNGEVVYKETINSESDINSANEWEKIQDVEIILQKVIMILNHCLSRFSDIQSIGLTGQMHGIVYVDKKGHAISPLYTWQDARGQDLVKDMNKYTKHPVASGYGLVSHIYNLQHDLVSKDMTYLCTVMDYLGMHLTQRTQPLMHVSNAASLGFWDLKKNKFEEDLLKQYGVDKATLPAVSENIVMLGTYQNIPVMIALGDNQASFLGTVGNENQTLLVNMGTGGQVSILTDTYREIKGVEIRPFIDGKYLLVGASLCGGKAYAILEAFLRNYVKEATGIEVSQYATMERLASQVHETNLSVCTTFNGTRTQPSKSGAVQNITEDNFKPQYLIYGFMQGMVHELYEMYEYMGEKPLKLKASGNGIRRNNLLQRLVESTFDLPLHLGKYEEEAACGAALSCLYTKKI